MSGSIVLYDLARRHASEGCWSYNVWKARLVVAYKNVPYTTAWVDHNTLAPELKSLGVPENTSGQGFPYTVPTIKLPDGSMLTDSAVIANKVESFYPMPPLHLDAVLEAEANEAVLTTFRPLFPNYMAKVSREVIREESVPAFNASREKMFGMSLDEAERQLGGEKAWQGAEAGLVALKALLTERREDEGPFILGSKISFADFMISAGFESLRRVDEGWFDRMVGWDKSFVELYEACEQWMKNDQ